ncbi:MAG TPA: hypothetical protein PLQ93_08245 [Bacteroidia bacterium]|nr:hypothetical protein [Bacteroidia bacterium]
MAENAFTVIRFLHITAGTVALCCGCLAILTRSRTSIHRPFGTAYFWSMTCIFASAVYMAVVKYNVFLFCVSFFTYYSCLSAYRALRLKKLHLNQKPETFDWLIELFFGSMHLLISGFAVYQMFRHEYTLAMISGFFGIIGIRGNWNTLNRFSKKPENKSHWLKAHIGGMLGSYIGTITAFTVNNAGRIPLPDIILWLGPTVLLLPFMILEIRKQTLTAE